MWMVAHDFNQPASDLSELVRDWNERWAFPRLRLSLASDFFDAAVASGASIPSHSWPYPDAWADGPSAVARQTARKRDAHRRIPVAEALAAMTQLLPIAPERWHARIAGMFPPASMRYGKRPWIDYPAQEIDDAYTALHLIDEHTYGSVEGDGPFRGFSRAHWLEKERLYDECRAHGADPRAERRELPRTRGRAAGRRQHRRREPAQLAPRGRGALRAAARVARGRCRHRPRGRARDVVGRRAERRGRRRGRRADRRSMPRASAQPCGVDQAPPRRPRAVSGTDVLERRGLPDRARCRARRHRALARSAARRRPAVGRRQRPGCCDGVPARARAVLGAGRLRGPGCRAARSGPWPATSAATCCPSRRSSSPSSGSRSGTARTGARAPASADGWASSRRRRSTWRSCPARACSSSTSGSTSGASARRRRSMSRSRSRSRRHGSRSRAPGTCTCRASRRRARASTGTSCTTGSPSPAPWRRSCSPPLDAPLVCVDEPRHDQWRARAAAVQRGDHVVPREQQLVDELPARAGRDDPCALPALDAPAHGRPRGAYACRLGGVGAARRVSGACRRGVRAARRRRRVLAIGGGCAMAVGLQADGTSHDGSADAARAAAGDRRHGRSRARLGAVCDRLVTGACRTSRRWTRRSVSGRRLRRDVDLAAPPRCRRSSSTCSVRRR